MKFGSSSEVQGFLSSLSISIVAMPAAFVIVLITSASARSNGVEMASLLFTGPLIGQVIVQPVVAICVGTVSVGHQAIIMLSARILAAILSIYLVIDLTSSTFILGADHYFSYGVWTLLGVVDQPLAVRANLLNCRHCEFSFLRSNAIGNLLGRGSMALAPFVLLVTTWQIQYTFWVLLVLISLFSLYAPWFTYRKIEPDRLYQDRTGVAMPRFRFAAKLSWEKWFVLFQFLANASIGAVGFLLLSSPAYKDLSPPPYSVLYSVFLAVQTVLVFKIVRLEKYATPRIVRILFLLISITVVVNGQLGQPFTILIGTIILGILYSLILPLMAETVARKIADYRLAASMTMAKSVGRIASIASIWFAGWALGNSIQIDRIKLMFGAMGIVAVIVLAEIERRLTADDNGQ